MEAIYKALLDAGLGGIIAGGMFFFYLKREKDILDDEKKRTETERLNALQLVTVVKENTVIITKLCEKLDKG